MTRGIVVTGGGAMLHGLAERLSSETGMPLQIAGNPLYSVVQGSGQCLENFDVLKGVLSSTQQ
jgi:rod shape-determining protein MreB